MFYNADGALRSGWWVALFLCLMTLLLLPLVLVAQAQGMQVPIWQQAAAVLVASLICQFIRDRPASEFIGPFDGRVLAQLGTGAILGAALMAFPAAFLFAVGSASWTPTAMTPSQALSGLADAALLFAAVAATEELMFRGFVFRRLVDGMGEWPAQFLVGLFFLLVHLDAIKEAGDLSYLAGLNIFCASLMFGLACLRSGGLAMPFALHFFANFVQGSVLGFGVSGGAEQGLLTPLLHGPAWLTGGAFGLEASVPGLVCVMLLTLILWRMRPLAGQGSD